MKPSVFYKEGAIDTLPEACRSRGWNNLLLVCGGTSFEKSGASRILPALGKAARWSDFAPNTDLKDVWRGLQVMRDVKPAAVIAVGGGSAMDMAKLLCAFSGVASQEDLVSQVRAGKKPGSRAQGLCLVPTTSGSGSEATHFAVAYDGAEKFSVAAPALYPDHVILDPALARSGDAFQRATSGIDAVCQSIESLWAAQGTETSRRFARHALSLLLRHIESFVQKGDARSAHGMCIGSHLAGRAIDVSRTTAAHALSYAITKTYGVSHGHAVALTLGVFIEAHAALPGPHQAVMPFILRALKAKDGREAARNFDALLGRLNLKRGLQRIGAATAEARGRIAASVNLERLNNNPVKFSQQDMLLLLEKAS